MNYISIIFKKKIKKFFGLNLNYDDDDDDSCNSSCQKNEKMSDKQTAAAAVSLRKTTLVLNQIFRWLMLTEGTKALPSSSSTSSVVGFGFPTFII